MNEITNQLANINNLTPWLDENIPQLGSGPLKTKMVHGGTSNVIISLNRGEKTMMLRRPPKEPPPNSEKAILREARVLSALNQSQVPHPHVYGHSDDISIIGAPFYVMEEVSGWSAKIIDEKIIHDAPFDNPEKEKQVAFAMVDGLIELGKVDYKQIGLEGFGKPDNYLERQVDRWDSQLQSYGKLYGYKGRELPGYQYIKDWLRANTPDDFKAGIIHGDVGTPNALFGYEEPCKLTALIDWELSTIGDPLLDLAWFLGGLRDEREPDYINGYSLYNSRNFPTRQELMRHYSNGTGRNMDNFDYYLVLARFKGGCICEYKVAQADAGILPPETGVFFRRLVHEGFKEGEKIARRAG